MSTWPYFPFWNFSSILSNHSASYRNQKSAVWSISTKCLYIMMKWGHCAWNFNSGWEIMNCIQVFLLCSSKKIADSCQNILPGSHIHFCTLQSCADPASGCFSFIFAVPLVFLDNTHACIFFLTVLTSGFERAFGSESMARVATRQIHIISFLGSVAFPLF